MHKDNSINKQTDGSFSKGLSIQQRLPLLICTLLLCIIVGFSIASYMSIKKAAMETGKERVRSLANNLRSMLSQSTNNLVTTFKKAADNDTLRQYLISDGKVLDREAYSIVKRLRTDSTVISAELLDRNFKPLLHYSESPETLLTTLRIEGKSFFSDSRNMDKVGKMYAINNLIYYPIMTAILNDKQEVGYLVNWGYLTTSPQAIEQVSKLMGKGAVLYLGNNDGDVWTDMNKPVAKPPIDIKNGGGYFEYTNAKDDKVISAVQPIDKSDWIVLIEYSKHTILEGASRFFKWLIIAGAVLLIVGIFIAWLMIHNMTRPLKQLTRSARAITKGDYSMPVIINRNDELGELAKAFNSMSEEIHLTQQQLEQKVSERTAQLETLNKEMEAFSYSVSHDLRGPLRGIVGYTSMLEDHCGNQFDDEAKRIASVIKSNTLRMGILIDDLLSFSRLGRKELMKTKIATGELVQTVIGELTPDNSHIEWRVEPLYESYGDQTTIKQVWINLISNAIKYSRNSAKPVIEIGSTVENDVVIYFVRDNGVGFDPKYKDKLFKVFQRLHTTSEFEGTGIGLAIVEKIISKHGGKVWVEAERDKGACFYFSIPLGE